MKPLVEVVQRCRDAECTGTCHGDASERNEVCEYEPRVIPNPRGRRVWTCSHHRELTRDRGRPWSELVLTRNAGGLRHQLDGRDVHCGTGLELQVVDEVYDDWGSYLRWLDRGVVVRYEASLSIGGRVSLYSSVAGYDVVLEASPSMRFRWPRGDR